MTAQIADPPRERTPGPALVKRLLVGTPLRTDLQGEQLLPKRLALPMFCSDPLSSVAYATQEILLVLTLGGVGLLAMTWWVAAAVAVLLVVVVASYRQTCYAYPEGGGAYLVSRANLGETPSLVAAAALLVDYVLTVAVSVVAGVAAVVSYYPALAPHAVGLSLGFIGLLTAVNLRGIRESGRGFAVPTYGFVLGIYAMFGWAAVKLATGQPLQAESAHFGIRDVHQAGTLLTLMLVLRAFASGCTALTGVEAVSNGIPAFRPPKSRNAARTLVIMGALAITMFGGITALAVVAHVHMADDPRNLLGAPAGYLEPTALAQLAKATFGSGPLYAYLQAATAAILILAANTAFNGFPVLASILAADGYLPRQLHHRGDRLVFSNGILLLAAAAAALIVAFNADISRLIQLYVLGVFTSFTLSQWGMVRHWQRRLTGAGEAVRRRIRRSQAVNGTGALVTGLVLLVVLATKFTHGAWIVCVAIPVLCLAMKQVHRHYRQVRDETRVSGAVVLPVHNHAVVLISRLHLPTVSAIGYAKAIHPDRLEGLHVQIDPDDTDQLLAEWDRYVDGVPLVVLDSPYREITRPVVEYVKRLRGDNPGDVVTVFLPEYVVGRWWEQLLHNQSALRIKARLLFVPGVIVTSVPFPLGSGRQRPHRAGPAEREPYLLGVVRHQGPVRHR